MMSLQNHCGHHFDWRIARFVSQQLIECLGGPLVDASILAVVGHPQPSRAHAACLWIEWWSGRTQMNRGAPTEQFEGRPQTDSATAAD